MQTRKEQLSAQIAGLESQISALRDELARTPDDAPAEADFSSFIDSLERRGLLQHHETETAAEAQRRAIMNTL